MNSMKTSLILLLIAGLATGIVASEARGPLGTRLDDNMPFLKQHCFDCHTGDEPEGGFNLLKLSNDLKDAEVRRRWVFLHDRVAAGEMPPKSAGKLDAVVKAEFLDKLGESLTGADLASREVILRRLNPREYTNTVSDLFGIYVDLSRLLPNEERDQGFDTNGAVLSLGPQQMVLYIQAADVVLDQVFGPSRKPSNVKWKMNAAKLRAPRPSTKITDDGIEFFNIDGVHMREASVRWPGTYRLKLQVRAVQSDKPLVMQVDGGVGMQIDRHVEGFLEVPHDRLATLEMIVRAHELNDSVSLDLIGAFPRSFLQDGYEGPGIFVGDIEYEGPLEQWPPPSRAALMGDVDEAKGTIDDVRQILSRVVPRAFRRSIKENEIEPFLELANEAIDEGLSFEKALRRALKGVLCSPEFLYLEERFSRLSLREGNAGVVVDGSPEPSKRRTEGLKSSAIANGDLRDGRDTAPQPSRALGSESQATVIDGFALASRLSYFLWSSTPDDKLLSLAFRGELNKPDVLRAQVERLLADPKSQRFVEDFAGQWLRLRDIDFTIPDTKIYPEYNHLLRHSMLDESHAFFREVLDHDMSVATFIDSDFVMINQPLAELYGIAGVKGLKIRKVKLPEDNLRGGVLTQAAILKVSADGTRTSPVLRGAWILKYLYGAPAPPPPPDVDVDPDIRGAKTLREKVAKHRESQSCNRCHRKIDPPGFALESFDVMGAQRNWYREGARHGNRFVKQLLHPFANLNVGYHQGADVDPSGTMPDGRKFADIREYRQLLLEDKTSLPRALVRMLLAYSVGREMSFSDRPEIERIVTKVAAKDYGLRSIIHEVVQSGTFRRP